MKRAIILILIICIGFNLFGDDKLSDSTTIIIKRRMLVGEYEYPFNLSGIEMLMEDLQIDDPEIYTKLTPEFKRIKNKNFNGILASIITGSLTLTSIGLWVYSIFDYNSPLRDLTFYIIAGGVGLASLIATPLMYYLFGPNENDFHRFVNIHNRINDEETIRLNLLPNFRNGIGLTLICQL